MGFDPFTMMAIATVATAGATVYSANKAASAAKKSAATVADTPVTPLPDSTDPAVKRRLAAAADKMRSRRGYASTLVNGGGQLGDTRAPPVSAPLVLGAT